MKIFQNPFFFFTITSFPVTKKISIYRFIIRCFLCYISLGFLLNGCYYFCDDSSKFVADILRKSFITLKLVRVYNWIIIEKPSFRNRNYRRSHRRNYRGNYISCAGIYWSSSTSSIIITWRIISSRTTVHRKTTSSTTRRYRRSSCNYWRSYYNRFSGYESKI